MDRKREWERYSSDWYERYLENPMDLTLRKRHEMMYGMDIHGRKPWWDEYRERWERIRMEEIRSRSSSTMQPIPPPMTSTGSVASATAATVASGLTAIEQAYAIAANKAPMLGIVPPWKLPSMRSIVIKNIVNVAILVMFYILNTMGYINNPLIVSLIMIVIGSALRSLPMLATAVILTLFGADAYTVALRSLGSPVIEQVAAQAYAKAFLMTIPFTAVFGIISILWNRRRIRQMRERWDNLVLSILKELTKTEKEEDYEEEYNDAGEKKEEVNIGRFFELANEENNDNVVDGITGMADFFKQVENSRQ